MREITGDIIKGIKRKGLSSEALGSHWMGRKKPVMETE
jgi:hypothetical protein